MDNRLEVLRRIIDEKIHALPPDRSQYFFTHLYGVCDFATLLAVRRNLDPEIAAACGMLHDIYPLTTGSYEQHGPRGAELARQLLLEMGAFTAEEIDVITTAISRHSHKGAVHEPYDEILKDADVLHHRLYNTRLPVNAGEEERYCKILAELGTNINGRGVNP